MKLDIWRKRSPERRRYQKRSFDQAKKLREYFTKYMDELSFDKQEIMRRVTDFNDHMEKKEQTEKLEETINVFLCSLPDSQVIEIKDI